MVYAIYIILIISYFYLFRKSILKNNYPILILACLFLGISVSIDIVFPSHGFEYLIEDGFKILGIFSWMLFYASVCARFLLPENNSIRKINNTISQ
jgi:hypothetical protein